MKPSTERRCGAGSSTYAGDWREGVIFTLREDHHVFREGDSGVLMAEQELDGEDLARPWTSQLLKAVARLSEREIDLLSAICTGKGHGDLSARAVQRVVERQTGESITETTARTRLYRLREKHRAMEGEDRRRIVRFLLQGSEGEVGWFVRYRRCGNCKTAVYLRPPDRRESTIPRGVTCPVCELGGGGRSGDLRLFAGRPRTDPEEVLEHVLGQG